jgi:hypothetical protein
MAKILRLGLAAMSSPHARQYDSINFAEYGLAFRIEDGWLDAIIAFDAICQRRDSEIIRDTSRAAFCH